MKNTSSGLLQRLVVVRTDVSEELSTFIIRVTRIGEIGTALVILATDAHCEKILREPHCVTSQLTAFCRDISTWCLKHLHPDRRPCICRGSDSRMKSGSEILSISCCTSKQKNWEEATLQQAFEESPSMLWLMQCLSPVMLVPPKLVFRQRFWLRLSLLSLS
jgi:hypothetical protein